jgi:hypothetical protein
MTDRRRRMQVPFDLGSSLKAPYGYTRKMRVADRAKRPPLPAPSRRDRAILNALLAGFYSFLVGGGILGWLTGHTWISSGIGAGLGAAIVVALYPVVAAVAFVVRSVRRSNA